MRQKTLQFLEAHQSDQPSTFIEDAKWRQENEVWLRWSRGIALSIADYMQENGLTRSDIANKLGCVTSVCQPHSLRQYKFLIQECCRNRKKAWNILHGGCCGVR